MTNPRRSAICLLVLLALCATSLMPVAAGTYPTSTTLVPAGQNYMPHTDGATVIWSVGAQDLYGMSLAHRRSFPIATGGRYRVLADIDAGVVVWLEIDELGCSFCEMDVRATEPASGREWELGTASAYGSYASVAIDGD
jgi:hypothetical protein